MEKHSKDLMIDQKGHPKVVNQNLLPMNALNNQNQLMAHTLHSNNDHPIKTEPKEFPEDDSKSLL